jgi:hypothetical protein
MFDILKVVHAFLAWFDVSFGSAHKVVKFSTGPHAKYTHWKYVFLPHFILFGSLSNSRRPPFQDKPSFTPWTQ